MRRAIAILGSTGSIGRQGLEIARELGLTVSALTCRRNIALLAEQILEFCPEVVSVGDSLAAEQLREILSAKFNLKPSDQPEILTGKSGLETVAALPEIDLVLAAVVGFAGLSPVLAALEAGKDIALANKETLVAGGEIVMGLAHHNQAKILPVDSEHSAIWQCLSAAPDRKFKRIFLTASGGPFRTSNKEELTKVTPAQALRHPTWEMGAKITIDSATMMNKGLEIIEACHLFSCTPDQIEVVVHPQSIVHSMVELNDGSVVAQLGFPDMRLPIRLALTWPDRPTADYYRPYDPCAEGANHLVLESPNEELFPALELARSAFVAGGLAPCVLNAANEAAVALFLQEKIAFPEIWRIVAEALTQVPTVTNIDFVTLEWAHNDTIARIMQRHP
ncbi:MAG: 1-deoxy-D-xylulose-5-phosphate reductoisomerase [Clostridiales bacterium]|nr:1-deoxy-D-xylulose-5-phosphate reductoisomerase [Clostridiales bacterium]